MQTTSILKNKGYTLMIRNQKYDAPASIVVDRNLVLPPARNRASTTSADARPFVKWVGGKRSIVATLQEQLPPDFRSYHEPFLGGGALYFAIQPQKAYLSDINLHLVVTYQAVRDSVEPLIRYLRDHENKHCKEYYLAMREQMGKERDATKLASIFIYINKTCYNGLYRVNQKGGFNVPMGNYKNVSIVDEENLRKCAQTLKGACIEQHSFEQATVFRGGFYYLDPPYHEKYSKYSNDGFGDEKHRTIADYCKKLDKAGAYFMLSNSDTPFVRDLYQQYSIEAIQASRFVSCKSDQRGKESELIIRNY